MKIKFFSKLFLRDTVHRECQRESTARVELMREFSKVLDKKYEIYCFLYKNKKWAIKSEKDLENNHVYSFEHSVWGYQFSLNSLVHLLKFQTCLYIFDGLKNMIIKCLLKWIMSTIANIHLRKNRVSRYSI